MTTNSDVKTAMPEFWVAQLIVRDSEPDQVNIRGYITKPDELRRFIEKLRTLAPYLPDNEPETSPERTHPIMPRQKGGLTRAAQKTKA